MAYFRARDLFYRFSAALTIGATGTTIMVNEGRHPVHDAEPAFCCCEFIDQYGERKHLGDASSCDEFFGKCCTCDSTLDLQKVLADVDDRLRLPQYNGAVHAGFDGTFPALLLPFIGNLAARGPLHAVSLVVLSPPLLAYWHVRTLRMRRQPRFFLGWTLCTYIYGNLAFTARVGEHFWFGYWLICATLQGAAAACAAATRMPPRARAGMSEPTSAEEGIGLVGAAGEQDRQEQATMTDESQSEGEHSSAEDTGAASVKCAYCGLWIAGYDHHCIWLNACIGKHNLGVFLRGCLALLAALALQGVLCAQRASELGAWGVEAVMALYALVLCLALLALLFSITLNLARGLTAHQIRQRRRQGQPLPSPSVSTLLRGVSLACSS